MRSVLPQSIPSSFSDLQAFLDAAVQRYNRPDFIPDDPISVPHRFSRLQDREISGFWAATLAWGQRKTIVNNANRLVELMDDAPYDFIRNHEEKDRARFVPFKHRTFQTIDTLYFLEFFQHYYRQHDSLEHAFARHLDPEDITVEKALAGFHRDFFDHPLAPARTRKHVATPERGSSCKRINMFLRWMVRRDEQGVDFGVWKKIRPAQLLMPLDVHVERIARQLGLLDRPQTDWKAVLELTERLRAFDPEDPVKYDFALFGQGVLGHQLATQNSKLETYMDERAFISLTEYLKKIPGIDAAGISCGEEDGLWWYKFSIDIKHKLAWRVVQELAHVINYISVEERLPAIFYPVSPPPYLNGGPDEYLSWVIETKDKAFKPGTLKKWLEERLPKPVEDKKEWVV